jgi:hypothetical protein
VPDDVTFMWPAAGAMQVTSLPGGGCNIKFSFADHGVVRAIGKGLIARIREVPTKRIARQYEIIVRHEHGFESSYSIVDQTPHLRAGESGVLRLQGAFVEDGSELYDIRNGGSLHFQLYRTGKLVDPRAYIREELGGAGSALGEAPKG